jgi:acyl carrier protein
MDHGEIVRRVDALLIKEFELDAAKVSPTAGLSEDLGLDSLDRVDLIAALERDFGLRIDRQADEKVLRAMRTVQDIYSYLDTKLAA